MTEPQICLHSPVNKCGTVRESNPFVSEVAYYRHTLFVTLSESMHISWGSFRKDWCFLYRSDLWQLLHYLVLPTAKQIQHCRSVLLWITLTLTVTVRHLAETLIQSVLCRCSFSKCIFILVYWVGE